MANRFLNNITINDAYTLPSTDGTAGQAITTDGAGNLAFSTVDSALKITLRVKNVSGETLNAGTLVRVAPSANPPSGNVLEVDIADNSAASTMPAVGILTASIANEAEGDAVAFGRASGFSTSGYTEGDPIWVGSNGAFIGTKPTGSDLIQKVGQIIKVHPSNGSIEVFGAGRTNDVPNLSVGKIWVGTTTNTAESTLVEIDETNNILTVGGKIYYSNVFDQEADLPSATTYHGMFAHVHGTGYAYYAHAGAWIKLVRHDDDYIHVKNYIELGDESLGGMNYLFKRNPFNLGFELRLNDVSLQPLWEIFTVNGNETTTKFNTDVEITSGRDFKVNEAGISTSAPTLNLNAPGTFINGNVEAVNSLIVKNTAPGTVADRSTNIGAGQILINGDAFNNPGIEVTNFYQPTSTVRLEVDDSATLRIFKTNDANANVDISGDLLVGRNVYADGDVVAFFSSDKMLKDNIKPIDSALDKVCKLGGYEFDWNDKQDVYEGHDIGVIAQEVEAVFPELVTDRDNGFKAVKYEKLVPALIEAIKEQQEQINELKTKLDGITN